MRRLLIPLLVLFVGLSCLAPSAVDPTPVAIDVQPLPATSTNTPTPTALPTEMPVPVVVIPIESAPSDTPVVVSAPTLQPVVGDLLVTFIDVGQGDAILIQSPEGQTALIDGGESDSGIVAKLNALGVRRIDVMIATHPHSDHIGGLTQVLRAMPVSRVVTNGRPHTTLTYERFLDAIFAAQAEYIEAQQGDVIPLGSLRLDVLSPASNYALNDLNEGSLVVRLQHGSVAFLFTGDAGIPTENRLMASGQTIKADVLKVGHHGSKSSSSLAFLQAVKPTIAVYTAGAGNRYGHPAPSVITNLVSAGAQIYGSDQHGTIVVRSDGTNFWINLEKNEPAVGAIAPPAPAAPLATPSPAAVSDVTIVSVTSPVDKGATASLTASAAPGAACNITVYYKSGPSKASGLEPKTTDASGRVSWQWRVGVNTTPGTWRIVVKCGDKSAETTFTVK